MKVTIFFILAVACHIAASQDVDDDDTLPENLVTTVGSWAIRLKIADSARDRAREIADKEGPSSINQQIGLRHISKQVMSPDNYLDYRKVNLVRKGTTYQIAKNLLKTAEDTNNMSLKRIINAVVRDLTRTDEYLPSFHD